MISYDNHPQIRKAYRGCQELVYSLPYSAVRRYEGSEVMFFSEGLRVPPVKSPLKTEMPPRGQRKVPFLQEREKWALVR
jgi:hypothetical protein